jgi:hypothetical protein
MKIFSRILLVCALLCGLAYGSFAFGKYVLSNKLFGEPTSRTALRTVAQSTDEAAAVTRRTNWKGDKPRVEVRVLGADEAGPAPQTSAFADEDNLSTERRTDLRDAVPPSTLDKAKTATRSIDDATVDYSLGDEGSSRRRRRRHRHSDDSNSANKTTKTGGSSTSDSARADATGAGESTPAGDGASSENGDDSAITITAGEGDGSSASSARNSSSRSDETSHSRRRRSRSSSNTSRRATSHSASPVPQPEDSGSHSSGGDSADISPVPQPE